MSKNMLSFVRSSQIALLVVAVIAGVYFATQQAWINFAVAATIAVVSVWNIFTYGRLIARHGK